MAAAAAKLSFVPPDLNFGFFETEALAAPVHERKEGPYQAAIWHPLPGLVDERITSCGEVVRSWRPEGPPKATLAYVQVTHLNRKGEAATGELIVHESLALEIVDIASDIFGAAFPIEGMRLIDYFDADDDRSMRGNNSSALCVRPITGGGTLSNHSLGRAVDLNTRLNPYHHYERKITAPVEGEEFLDRTRDVPGMIKEGDAVVRAFDRRGWEWGGRWKDRVDYQHFQKPEKKGM